ncbi:hypothetical protein AB9P05_03275 [Roseivirga sp. BDSF3-8]|uniref:tetratricopeptide repeat protein n=1 Tax=Roseivirga sp. BDSF3-8 TaxID=3241598 RepID=UPI003531C812
MLGNLFFWRLWKPAYRYLFLPFLFSLIALLIAGAYWYIQGFANVLDWQVLTYLKEKSFLWKEIDLGVTQMPLTVDYFVTTEGFTPSNIQVSPIPYYLLLVAFAVAWCISLTVVTTFRSFWFYGSIGLLFFILVNLHPERLVLFGQEGYAGLILMSVLYFGPALYIYFKASHISLPVRFYIFGGITVIMALLIHFYSHLVAPFYLFTAESIMVMLIISIVFIIWIAHEPVAAFVYLATQSGRGGKANLHFTLLTLVYLVNVFLAFLHNTRVIDWDILYLDEFFLLSLSICLGLYGWRRSQGLFKGIFSVEPEGVFLYLGLALVCVSTACVFFASGNDAMIEVLEDAIIYSHMVIGFVFYLYILINFYDLIQRDLQAHKVLYRPAKIPFFTQRLLGLIIMTGLLFKASFFPFYQSLAGYYVIQGDTYNYLGDENLAYLNYEMGQGYEGSSFRANYTLAYYSALNDRREQVIPYYEKALQKNPAPYGYVSLANIYEDNDRFFDALFLLQQGLDPFPGEGHLLNNAGLLYASKKLYDSAFYYFEAAAANDAVNQTASTNAEAMVVLSGAGSEETAKDLYSETAYLPAMNNLLIQLRSAPEFPENAFKDSVLNNEQFAYLYNYLLKDHQGDTHAGNLAEAARQNIGNMPYQDYLLLSKALADYHNGHQARAVQALEFLGRQVRNPGYYYYLLAGLAADQMSYRLAVDYLERSAELKHKGADEWLGKMYLLSGEYKQADSLFTYLTETDSSGIREEISKLSAIASFAQTGFSSGAEQLGPDRLAVYLPERVNRDSSLVVDANPAALAFAHLVQAKNAIATGQYEQAEYHLAVAERSRKDFSPQLKNRVTAIRLDYLLATGRYSRFRDMALDTEGRHLAPYRVLATAQLAYDEGQSEKATTLYTSLVNNYPFFEQGVLRSTDFFYSEKNEELLGYESLLGAIKLNPYSISLTKAYVDYSLLMGLEEYAEDKLSTLKSLMPENVWQAYYEGYLQRKNEKLKSAAEWN